MGHAGAEPQHLSAAISELITLRGLANSRGNEQLAKVWKEVAGDKTAQRTRVLGVKRGVLEVGVSTAPLMSELASFHKLSLLNNLKSNHPELKIRDLKFRLKGDLDT